MEYERGHTLHAAVSTKNLLDQTSALQIAIALLSGLEVVCANGIIHRDIKPANIYICEDRRPVLLDFGSARGVDPEEPRNVTQLITTGFSPFEQYESSAENQGLWTHIYSLAASLLSCLSGASPRKLDSKKRMASRDSDPLVLLMRALVTDKLVAVDFAKCLLWALQLEQHKRPQTAAEFRRALEKHAASSGAANTVTWDPVDRTTDVQVERDFTTMMGDTKVTRELRDRAKRTAASDIALSRMMIIPTGSFMFGSPPSEAGREAAKGPQLWVEIRDRFAMSRYPITTAEFTAYLRAHERIDEVTQLDSQDPLLPVVKISGSDAHAYTHWLREVTGKHYRLPSEQEWEWSARGHTTTAFPWGEQFDRDLANVASTATTPIGQFPANDFGLCDCSSNVREWIADAWHENHLRAPLEGQARSPAKSLPLALRVTKGGACSSAAQTWAFEWFATSKAGAIIDRLRSIECQCARFQKRSLAPKNGRLASEVMMTAVYRIDSKSDITVQRDTRALCTLNKMLLT